VTRYPRLSALALAPNPAFAITLALVAAGAPALAQDVHKCVQAGEVTYQATPCPGADKVLRIEAGPGDDQVEAARGRAAAQKARMQSPSASDAAHAASGATPRADLRP
jgi:hypothetical protein